MNGQPSGFLSRVLQLFFYLLYQPLAWSYDLVAWLVSLGRWGSWIKSVLPLVSGPRVLELGHGPGHLQRTLNEQGMTVFGLDRSPQMGRLARRRLKRASLPSRLVRAEAEALPLKTGSVDQILSTFPSEYILQSATLSEIKRVLTRQGGEALILPVAWITGRDLLSRAAAALFRVTGQAGEWDGRFTQRIAQAGFEVEERLIEMDHSRVMLLRARPDSVVQ